MHAISVNHPASCQPQVADRPGQRQEASEISPPGLSEGKLGTSNGTNGEDNVHPTPEVSSNDAAMQRFLARKEAKARQADGSASKLAPAPRPTATDAGSKPIEAWDELGDSLPRELMNALEARGMRRPTPIQAEAVPLALAGHDVIGIAQTGSGKTVAFALPLLCQVLVAHGAAYKNIPTRRSPLALVVAPTRELAIQIADEMAQLLEAGGLGGAVPDPQSHDPPPSGPLRVACLYGGGARWVQDRAVRARPAIIVATPGRLMDFVGSGALRLDGVQFLVLDEADNLLSGGFENDTKTIHASLDPSHRTMLLSARRAPRRTHALANGRRDRPCTPRRLGMHMVHARRQHGRQRCESLPSRSSMKRACGRCTFGAMAAMAAKAVTTMSNRHI